MISEKHRRKYHEYKDRLKRVETPMIPRDGNTFLLAKAWICIGWRDYDKEILSKLPERSKLNLHFIVTDARSIGGDMIDVIEDIVKNKKYIRIVIHTPYELRDLWNFTKTNTKNPTLVKWIKLLKDKSSRVTFENNRHDLIFGTTNEHIPSWRRKMAMEEQMPIPHPEKVNYKLRIHYENGTITCSTLLYEDKTAKPMSTLGAIRTPAQRIDPYAHKDEIIANFKSVTPLGILKTFKNEEDLWRFIVDEQHTDIDTVKKRPGPKIHTNPETVHISPVNIDLRDKLSPEEAAEHIGLTAGQKALDEILKSNL